MIYKSYLVEQNLKILKNKIVLLYGENLGLKNDLKKQILNNSDKVLTFNQEDILGNQDNFLSDLFNISLFDDKKIYFINQISDKFLNIVQQLENRLDTQKLYLFADKLEKKSKLRNHFEKSNVLDVIPCYHDNEISIRKIILQRLKDFKSISAQNVSTIIENTNYDRAKLNNELDKIEIFFSDKKIITSKLIELLNLKENDDFNLIKDAAMSGNTNKTNKLLSDTVLESDKIIFYITILNQRLIKLKEILSKNNQSLEQTIETLKPPIFWKDKAQVLEQSKKWNLEKINNTLKKTFDLELKHKSNSILNKNILMKKLLIDICTAANA